ncbi:MULTISPECIES: metallophosphoesterase [unclassified Meiothermus]|uniref:metallophosphoesterase n=1 Tax=unclassified Meiothermus TaxID=370471 RepID=UPI000D7CE228|nr:MULTISPECIES: metallophosphoesterase [unclassified Meiothermus]PZA08048.1 metallophosphoesterase [Meiothermus sp. Pnk-1]RYM32705.1 metallophosphoesterase [Meiothermus sp. PNK-Is4]
MRFPWLAAHEVNRYARPLPGLERPVRVAHLSDLHIGHYIDSRIVRRWVETTVAHQPDLIVITGDLTDSENSALIRPAVAEMGRLRAPLGVWAVWGNHDYRLRAYRSGDLSDLETWLEASGVRVLNNAGVRLREDLYLAGVDDLWHGRPDVARALEGLPDGAASLLLCHNPDYLFEVPAAVGLTLCGHTHGGQIWVPFLGAVFTSSKYGKRFAQGWIEDPVPAFVSRGLGVSTVPLRYRFRAEVVIMDLLPS